MRMPQRPLGTRAPRWVLVSTLVGAVLAVAPAAAGAATLNAGNYTAAAGETNELTVTDNGTTLTYVDPTVAITASNGCTPLGPNLAGAPVTCPEADFFIDLLDGNDTTTFVGLVDVEVRQFGGTGVDTLRGGSASVTNVMDGEAGADILIGGTNLDDYVDYRARTAAVNISLDGVVNDGEAAEGDNVLVSVENVITGPGNDTITGSAADNEMFSGAGIDSVSAGAGADTINGEGGNDTVSGDAGDDAVYGSIGADTVSGGDGDDEVYPGGTSAGVADGADSVSGGPGMDYMGLSAVGPGPAFAGLAVSATLDDTPNDGIGGEGDNYRSDIEDVSYFGDGAATLVGTAGINVLSSDAGNDSITGAAGNDVLRSFAGNDIINARDGFADRVECGSGVDTAVVDTLDQVSPTCETVQRADVGNANDIPEDTPPTVAFTAPRLNALIPQRGATVSVNAADDRGIARVVLLDDGRVVGTDTVAPYAFAYVPRGDDLGSNTLIAMAVDGRNQTTTALRTVRVGKFNPVRVTESVSPTRDRARPFRFRVSGRVRRPATVTTAQGCSGTVTVTMKRGARSVARRTVKLSKACTYSVRVSVGSRGRMTIKSRFNGNDVLKARSSASRRVRAG